MTDDPLIRTTGKDFRARFDREAEAMTSEMLARVAPELVGKVPLRGCVWSEDAFPGFVPSEQRYDAMQILSSSQRPLDQRPKLTWDPHLPSPRCAAPGPHGGQCGRVLAPLIVRGRERYWSTHCVKAQDGHLGWTTRHIEPPLIAMLCDAYDADELAAAIAAIPLRLAASRGEIRVIEARLALIEKEYSAVARKELDAITFQEREEEEHWGSQRRALQRERLTLETRSRDLQRFVLDPDNASDGLADQLALVRELAPQLPQLFAKARRVRGLTRMLVSALTRRIAVRVVCPFFALVEVEFPNGAIARRLILMSQLHCTQPERALASVLLQQGCSAEEVGERLRVPTGAGALRSLYPPDHIIAFALAHRYFEPVVPRVGPDLTIAVLAGLADRPEDEVFATGLTGALGPARPGTDGTLLLAPTLDELALAFPVIARRVVADREGWPVADTILVTELLQEYGLDAAEQRRLSVSKRVPFVRDSVRRLRWTRRSVFVRKIVGGRKPDPDARQRRFDEARRAAVVQAGYLAATAPHFVPSPEVLRLLRLRFRYGNHNAIEDALLAGRVASLRYRGPSTATVTHGRATLLYCPPSVLEASSVDTVRAWLRGDGPTPARRGRRAKSGDAPSGGPTET